jgi:hypothetical protein
MSAKFSKTFRSVADSWGQMASQLTKSTNIPTSATGEAKSKASDATGGAGEAVSPLELVVEFPSSSLPFACDLDDSGNVVITALHEDSATVDPRITMGLVVEAINDVFIAPGANAYQAYSDAIATQEPPLRIRFRAHEDQAHSFTSSVKSNLNKVSHTVSDFSRTVMRMASSLRASAEPPAPTHAQAASEQAQQEQKCWVHPFEYTLRISTTNGLPFEYELYPDGKSIVVTAVKRPDVSDRLRAGSFVRAVGDQVLPQGPEALEVLSQLLETTVEEDSDSEAPPYWILTMRDGPVVFRPEAARRLCSQSPQPIVHIATWLPQIVKKISRTVANPLNPAEPLFRYGQEAEFEDFYSTVRRANQFVESMKQIGVAVTVLNMETVIGSPSGARYDGQLKAGSPLLQGTRLWFTFPEAIEVRVNVRSNEVASLLDSLQVDADGGDGSWIVVSCHADSAWAEAGMAPGKTYILTHVDDQDVCPLAFRTTLPRARGRGTFFESIAPIVRTGTCKFRLV